MHDGSFNSYNAGWDNNKTVQPGDVEPRLACTSVQSDQPNSSLLAPAL